jgi:hypothetical protein
MDHFDRMLEIRLAQLLDPSEASPPPPRRPHGREDPVRRLRAMLRGRKRLPLLAVAGQPEVARAAIPVEIPIS